MMNSPLSVVHVTNDLGYGGTQKAMEVFVRNLDKTEHDISVCGYKSGGRRGRSLEDDGYPVFVTNSEEEFAEVLGNQQTDILHLHGMYDTAAEAVEIAKSAGVDIIVKTTPFGRVAADAESDIDLHLFPSKMALLRHLKLENANLRNGDWNRKYRLQYYPLSTNDVSDRHKDDLRDELGIEPGVPVVGKIGRSSAAKWSEVSIAAFDRICNVLPKTRILLVTPPEKIRNAISQRGLTSNVEYLDPIPPSEVGKFYNTIDVLAHASAIGESFGYVIAEAMAYGTPVVVDSNPMRDNAQVELVNNNETGYVAGSTEAYAGATVKLLQSDDLQHEFGTAAQRRARDLLDPMPIVAQLQEIYRELYESNGDSDALAKEIESQREMMAEFEREYNARLSDLYGAESTKHRFERGTWRFCSDTLPLFRENAYNTLQGLFKDI
jgi:glycosyltransferase involved in cell wall biosynthesis